MKDKFIKVVVTDEDGNEAEDETLSKVGVDASSDVQIIDTFGLQEDGTGIINDVLRLSYGSDFGTVTTVSWYRNGSVLVTTGSGNAGIPERDGGLTLIASAERGTGIYKATIVADGITYTTNEIEITDKESPAEILDFTLEDDYTDGLGIHYATTDKRAIATVTLNKNYDGKFTVYRATDTTFKSPLATDALTTSTAQATLTAADAIKATAAVGDQESVLTTNAATNYQVLTANTIGSGYGYINADGTVTYKWVLDDTGVARGSDYVVAFDQASISSDKPGSGVANASEEATAPYVVAPASIAVTKVAAGVKPEITFYDKDDDVLGWFGYQVTDAAEAAEEANGIGTGFKTTLATVGASSAKIYAATNKTTDPDGSGVSQLSSSTANPVEGGVWTSQIAAGDEAYFFATVKFNKGIFDKDALELKSEAAATAQPAATDMSILEDKTTATSAVVSFANLRADGTVYVARGRFTGSSSGGSIDVINTVHDIVEAFNPDDATTYVAKTDVSAGAKSVTIENAIGSYTSVNASTGILASNNYYEDGAIVSTTAGNYVSGKVYGTDDYVAIFVPNDTDNYGQISTSDTMSKDSYTLNEDDDAFNSLRVVQKATSLSFDKESTTGKIATDDASATLTIKDITPGTNSTAGKFYAKDQFGNRMRTAKTNQSVTSVEVVDKDITSDEKAVATYDISAMGDLTLKVEVGNVGTPGSANVDNGDGFKVTLLGAVVEITNTIVPVEDVTSSTAGDGVAEHDTSTWTVKVGSDTLAAPTTALANKEAEADAIKALEDVDKTQIDNGATGTAIHFKPGAAWNDIDLSTATFTATSDNTLDNLTNIAWNAGNGTVDITASAARAGEVVTLNITTALNNKVTVKITTGAAALTFAGGDAVTNNPAGATTDTATIAGVKDQYGNTMADVATTEVTPTVTAAVTGATVSKIEYAISNGTLTFTVTGTTLTSATAGTLTFNLGGKTVTYTLTNSGAGEGAFTVGA